MKRFMLLGGVAMIGVLVLIAGCGIMGNAPQLTLAVSPQAGHPPYTVNIAAACSVPGGSYIFNPPVGDAIESQTGSFTAVVDTWPYDASVTWTDGDRVVTQPIELGLINERPVAHNLPFARAEYRTRTLIDLRYRQQGCYNGGPVTYTGIEDPDYTAGGFSDQNDDFLYRVEVYDKASGDQETVYTQDGQALAWGEYVPTPVFYWFPGWTQIHPPYPLDLASCVPNPPPADDPGATITKAIHVWVKEFGAEYHWVYEVEMTGGPCH